MRMQIFRYILAFTIGVLVGLLIAYLILNSMPNYPYIHGLRI